MSLTLLDLSAFMYRCQVPVDPSSGHGRVDYWRYLFMTSLRKLLRERDCVVFCCDRKPTHKLALYPEYKGTREHNENYEDIHTAIDPVLKFLPSYQVFADGEEADDVIASMAYGRCCTVVSLDCDLWQLLSPEVQVIDLRKGYVTEQMCHSKFGVRPDQIALYKTWLGDNGDNVPRLPRIPEKLVVSHLIGERTALEDSLEFLETLEAERVLSTWYQKLLNFVDQAIVNWSLVKLNPHVDLTCTKSDGDEKSLLGLMPTQNGINIAHECFELATRNIECVCSSLER